MRRDSSWFLLTGVLYIQVVTINLNRLPPEVSGNVPGNTAGNVTVGRTVGAQIFRN